MSRETLLRMSFIAAVFITVVMLCASGHLVASEEPASVSFVNDVIPVLTKAGCNGGSCHAKAGGRNGFQLSLLGFEADDDYENIVLEDRGRRIFQTAPEQSLLLTKASGKAAHQGGVRLTSDSAEYEILRRWIQQGMPRRIENDPEMLSLEVKPTTGIVKRGGEQQLHAIAKYSDGSVRDVTSLALYESNTEAMAEVDEAGLVSVSDIPGKAAIMVRYQGKIAVFTAAIPLGATVNHLPEARNFVDEQVFANLKELGIPPSPLCDDATFLRRVSLDIAGRLPSIEETKTFLADTAPDKRDKKIEALLRSPQYADYFAGKWAALLKNRRDATSDITANFAFHSWIRDSFLTNVPYDQLVTELLAATGTIVENPPVAWYKRVKDPKVQLEDIAQLFLGVRMQCAQCHHHPFERWSQDDYYSFSAFFSQIGRKPTATAGEDLIFHKRGTATAKNIRSGQTLVPAALGDDVGKIPPGEDPRLRLAKWMSSPGNPFFAKALVNRYWKHFFKRGLIEPEDDIRDTNPPSNPKLLAALESHFISSGYDLKELVRVITQSRAYQLSAIPNEHNLIDEQNYSRFYPRRMQAEVLLDAVNDITGSTTSFANLPAGTRAIALPDNSYNRASGFLNAFGRPNNASVCECERVQSSSLSQSLFLINSSEVKTKLAASKGRAISLMNDKRSDQEKITELYFAVFSRAPRENELKIALNYLNEPLKDAQGKPIPSATAIRQNWQDLIWALINTKEFLFHH